MSRRTAGWRIVAGRACVLVLAAGGRCARRCPYVTFAPGPTVNVLGKYDGKPIIEVSGHKTYPTRATCG